MKKYELIHQDTCLPYALENRLPVVQIPLTCETTYQDVYDQLMQWDCYDHIENVTDLMFSQAVEDLFGVVKAAQHMDTMIDVRTDEEEEYTDSVYAFFTLNMFDTPEELEEYKETLDTMYNAAVEDGCPEEAAQIAEEYRQDEELLSYSKMVECQMYHWPQSKILTEAQVWMYIDHLPEKSRAKKLCKMTMESAAQYNVHHVYYIFNNSQGTMGVRYGVCGQEYISGFSYGRGHDGE